MEVLKIKEFTEVITGGTPSTSKDEYWINGEIPWLNSGELQQDIITSTNNYITDLGLKNSSTRLMPPDSVLIALTGTTTGKVGYLTFEACANQSVTGILPSKKHFPKYLYYYLNSIRQKVMHDAYGGAQPHISQGYVKEISIPLPPLPEQKKIAAILDAADELRQKDKALVEKYNELTQALFLDMFGDPFENPKGWKWTTIKEITQLVKGITYSPKDVSNNGIIVLRSSNVQNSLLDLKDLVHLSKKVNENFYVKKNDILMCNRNGSSHLVGKVAKIPELNENMTFGTFMTIVRSQFHNYLFHYFQTKAFRMQIKMQTSVAINQISLPLLESVRLPLPPTEIQDLFEKRVTVIEKQKSIAQASAQKSEELFNSLLQKAFNGNLI